MIQPNYCTKVQRASEVLANESRKLRDGGGELGAATAEIIQEAVDKLDAVLSAAKCISAVVDHE